MIKYLFASLLATISLLASAQQNVGIGIAAPNGRLDITASNAATPAITDGILIPRVNTFPAVNPGANQNGMLMYLTTTAGANLPGFYYWEFSSTSWKAVGNGKFWGLSGNTGSNPATNFIGTTDDQDLVFKRNNSRAGLLGATNTSWGLNTLISNSGTNNSAFGTDALLLNTTGSYNSAFGVAAGSLSNNLSNATAIGSFAKVGCGNCLVLGDSINSVKIGIGTAFPDLPFTVVRDNMGISQESSNRLVKIGFYTNNTAAYLQTHSLHPLHFSTGNASAQMSLTTAGQLGIGNASPASSASLEVSSTARGFLPPRMSKSQRDAIVNPVAALMVWCIDCGPNGEAQVYNGGAWTNMSGGAAAAVFVPAIGDNYRGGKVAYILQPGDFGYDPAQVHGLIAAASDQSNALWGCVGTLIGSSQSAIGTGASNTSLIVNGCAEPGIAARICQDLVLNGYSDWYLPSLNELQKLALNKAIIGGFNNFYYWSSTETADPGYAMTVYMLNNTSPSGYKGVTSYIRPVRAF